ncbi:MAG: hypothetical protein ABEH81_15625 [Halopenitus sp.]
MTCPYLAYRRATDDQEFDTERAYCTASDQFVQPMRADICNDRYDLSHAEHCQIYLEAEAAASESEAEAGETEEAE